MKTLQHRRHSMRNIPGDHLNPRGIELAREVGRTMGRFDYVAASDLPRAIETAELMSGRKVDRILPALATFPEAVARETPWDGGFALWYDSGRDKTYTRAHLEALNELHRSLLEKVPEGGRLLVVSHGGVVEASAAGCLENELVRGWGGPVSYCEGFGAVYEGGCFVSGEVLRVLR